MTGLRLLRACVATSAAWSLCGAGAAMAEPAGCPKADALGVSRTVEIDTTGGPGFGMQHYKAYDFLQPKEVVLTFDDGPQKFSTEMVLEALAEQCAKATFFSIGKMALGYPEIIREVAKAGHTIGTHTWSHQSFPKLKTFEAWKDEMERGVSGVHRAVGMPIAPFFRYPTLKDSPESIKYLGERNIAMFSTDIDSFDFKLQPPDKLAASVLAKLEKDGKGIVLMHDIHKNTAKALPIILKGLKDKGFKLVHLTAKNTAETLPEFDALIEKDTKGLPQAGAERPTTSVVRTIEGDPTPEESAPPTPAPTKAEAPAPAPPAAGETGAAPQPRNPVSTTSSIDSASNASSEGVVEDEAGASKGLSDRAKDVWNNWFGKKP
ncbi:MAG: polysaccharide deacetylase family protein [Hyphomicrobium sp.]